MSKSRSNVVTTSGGEPVGTPSGNQTGLAFAADGTPVSALPRKQAAVYCGYETEQPLAHFASSGGGPKFVKIGRRVFYRISDLDDWLASHVISSTSEVSA